MKKIYIVMFLLLLLIFTISCTTVVSGEQKQNNRFQTIHINRLEGFVGNTLDAIIILDIETNIKYLAVGNSRGVGLTPLLETR